MQNETKEIKNIFTPIELFGIECGKGWEKLYKPLINYIEKFNKDKNETEQIQILQIKEKFGQLRFYVNFTTLELYEMIRNAERKSWDVCETCGNEKYVGHTHHYISICCIDCLKNKLEKTHLHDRWTSHDNKQTYEINENTIDEVLKNVKK